MSPNRQSLKITVCRSNQGKQRLSGEGSESYQGELAETLHSVLHQLAQPFEVAEPKFSFSWSLSFTERSREADFLVSGYVDVFSPSNTWIGEASAAHRLSTRDEAGPTCQKVVLSLTAQLATNLSAMSAKKVRLSRFSGVILKPQASGIWVHEAFGHGLLARESKGLLNQLAERRIQVFDDPTISELVGSYVVDDTGQAASAVLLSCLSLSLADRQRGRMRSEFAGTEPMARPTNTWAQGQEGSLEADDGNLVIEKIGPGFYREGRFYLKIQQSYLQKMGQKVWLSPIVIGGELTQAVDKIVAVGTDVVWSSSLCQDRSGILPTAHGGPTFAFSELEYVDEL